MTSNCELPWVLGIEPWSSVRARELDPDELSLQPITGLLILVTVNNLISGISTLSPTISNPFIIGFRLSACHTMGYNS